MQTRRLAVAKGTAAVLKQALRAVEARVDHSAVSDRELLLRFAQKGDQTAFSALVRRYSGMVLGVCRRTLLSVQDAEDACQATFLVLARKAAGEQWRQSLANWLYTTARRVAANARRAAERRARREGKAALRDVVEPADQMTGRELLAALDEELDKLSPRYREPLVLCYLEGLTRDEAASRLGVPAGTVKIQLERGRKKLGDALVRRGCGLGAGLLALAVTSPAGAAPPRLIEAVLASVLGSPSAAVAELARGFTMNACIKKAMSIVIAVVAAGVLAVGSAAVRLPAASQSPAKGEQAKPAGEEAKDAKTADATKDTVSGQVLNPAGKPVAGAELILVGGKKPLQELGRTDNDGRFTVAAPRGQRWVNLIARAPGFGIDFIDLGTLKGADKVELRLIKDHPVRGRVIDTEGKPVSGVRVSVKHVGAYKDNSLDSFLAMWKKRHPMSGLPGGIKRVWNEGILPPATTDKDGRFSVAGCGIERVVQLNVRGTGVAEAEYWVVNRPGFDPKPYNKATADNMVMMPFDDSKWLLLGPDLTAVAEAEKPIRGVVKDQQTGKPRAGVRVTLSRNGGALVSVPVSATTDAEGRYEIRGARKSPRGYMVEVPSDPDSGHMACQGRSADTPGYGTVTIDLNMRKGVILTGKVIDQSTGKPVPGIVWLGVLQGNSFAKEYPEFGSAASFYSRYTDADGTFRMVTIPGPVLLMGTVDSRKWSQGNAARYLFKPPVPDPKFPQYFPKGRGLGAAYFTLGGGISPLQGNFAKVVEIKPGVASVTQDVTLERANSLAVKIVDADDRPVKGAWVTGISPQDWHYPERITKDSFNAYHLEPGKPRLIAAYDPANNQYGTLRLKGDEKDAAVVKLGPCGTVTGRLVDENGRPVAGARIQFYHRERTAQEIHSQAYKARPIETDGEGKFTVEVVPEVKFSLFFNRGKKTYRPDKKEYDAVAAGKSFELGDVKINLEAATGEE
jgi:RNA polymerase sigma factor (sigma-70 family)